MNLSTKQIALCAAVMFCVVMALRSCGSDEPQQAVIMQHPQTQHQVQVEREAVQQEPNMVVVQQPPQVVQQSSGITAGHLAAGALGYMAGRNSNSNSYGSNRPVINKNYYSKKVYVSKPSRSYFGSSTTKRFKRR